MSMNSQDLQILDERMNELIGQHCSYVENHPELREILTDFLASVLLHCPDDVFGFAREYFCVFSNNNVGSRPGSKSH